MFKGFLCLILGYMSIGKRQPKVEIDEFEMIWGNKRKNISTVNNEHNPSTLELGLEQEVNCEEGILK